MFYVQDELPPKSANLDSQDPHTHILRVTHAGRPEPLTDALDRRFNELLAIRSRVEPVWREIQAAVMPYSGLFDGQEADYYDRKDRKMLTGVTQRAVEFLQSSLMGGLTDPAKQWFGLQCADPWINRDISVRRWLDACDEILRDELQRSNYYASQFAIYKELMVGTAPKYIEFNDRSQEMVYTPFTFGTYVIGFDATGHVQTFGRDTEMSTEHLVDEFGLQACPRGVLEDFKAGNYGRRHTLRHVLISNNGGGSDISNDKYVEAFYIKGTQVLLRLKEHEMCPVVCPRWEIVASETYGIGPAWGAIGDAKMVNRMWLDLLTSHKMHMSPPMAWPKAAENIKINRNPGGNTYGDFADVIPQPLYQVQTDNAGHLQLIMMIEERIRSAFYNDLFLISAQNQVQNRTATEAAIIDRERLQVLGPLYDRVTNDDNNPTIGTTFVQLYANGHIPPPPEVLFSKPLKIEYFSPIARAQKSANTGALAEALSFVGMASQLDPSVVDAINMDETIAEFTRANGVPASTLRDAKEVAAIRQSRAEAQQAQQQQMQAVTEAETMSKMAGSAKTLAETPTSNESILAGLLESVQAP